MPDRTLHRLRSILPGLLAALALPLPALAEPTFKASAPVLLAPGAKDGTAVLLLQGEGLTGDLLTAKPDKPKDLKVP